MPSDAAVVAVRWSCAWSFPPRENDRINVTARLAVPCCNRAGLVYQLLTNADGLEVHTNYVRNWRLRRAIVNFAVDLVKDRHHLKAIITLDVLEAPGVVGARRRCELV